MSFRVLLDGMIDYLGEDDSPGQEKHYKFLLNNSLQMISEDDAWDFLKRRGVIKLLAPKKTGTFDVTNGSTLVKANTVSLSYDMVGGEIEFTVTDDANKYEVIGYDPVTSELELSYPYQGATTVGVAFNLVKLYYVLERDVAHVHIGKTQEHRHVIVGHGDEFSDFVDPFGDSTGIPSSIAMKGFTDRPLYDKGTVAITHNSTTVTGTGTVFDAEFVGRSFRVAGDMRIYRIKTVTNGVTIVLDEPYRSEKPLFAAITTSDYQIQPVGSAEVSFEFGQPDTDLIYTFVFSRVHPWLVVDTEYPVFPERLYNMVYAHVKWQLMEEEDEPVEVVRNAERRYEKFKKKHAQRHDTVTPKFIMPTRGKVGRAGERFGANQAGVDGAGGVQWGWGG